VSTVLVRLSAVSSHFNQFTAVELRVYRTSRHAINRKVTSNCDFFAFVQGVSFYSIFSLPFSPNAKVMYEYYSWSWLPFWLWSIGDISIVTLRSRRHHLNANFSRPSVDYGGGGESNFKTIAFGQIPEYEQSPNNIHNYLQSQCTYTFRALDARTISVLWIGKVLS
jgi:hypothetical protein